MRIKQTINLFFTLILIGATFACKTSSGETLAGIDKAYSSENSNSTFAAETNKKTPTLIPVAKDCPLSVQSFSAKDVEDGEVNKYNGCTINVTGKLQAVSAEYVTIYDQDSSKTVSCGGNFSSEIYSQIGHKLYDLKSKGWGYNKFPNVRFSAKVKQFEAASSVALTDCVMTDFSK